jgi:dihydrolipoamide dehydrogenase
MSESYDLGILGGGPGGYVAAVRASQLGGKVALVEMGELGGTCLNRGCIPTKALLHCAELCEAARNGGSAGLAIGEFDASLGEMQRRCGQVVGQLRKGVEHLMQANGVTVVRGRGRLADARTIAVEGDSGAAHIVCKNILLATGSVPSRIPVPGTDAPDILDSDRALTLTEPPGSLAIIGGGVIGLEFGYLFAALDTKVTIIEMLDHILPNEDPEIVEVVARAFRRRKIAVHAPARVNEVRGADGKQVVVFSMGEKKQELEVEKVLVAVGRTPRSEGLGLEAVGIEMNRRAVKVNERMETSVPGIYACGDLIGGWLLAHVAFAEGEVAAENAMGRDRVMDYRAVPACVYTQPEVASVGLSEPQAAEAGREVKVGRFFFRSSGKALAMGERDGLVKVVADAQTGEILGTQMVGPRVTDLIAEATLAVQQRLTVDQIAVTIHPHPTLSEPFWEAARDAFGRALHK